MSTAALSLSSSRLRTILINVSALVVVYFMPAISHMLSFPIYMVEPMRIMLILAIAHTSKYNAYLLALTLPVFSYLISAHPVFLKSLLISLELAVNVWLFYSLMKFMRNNFLAMITAIIGSKLFYYALKLGLFSLALLDGKFISIPVYLQLATSLIFSIYVAIILRRAER